MKNNAYSLRALALLLGYPDQDLRALVPQLLEVIDSEAAVGVARRRELHSLAVELLGPNPMDVEARYVETFDRGRATSLHLFEHVHGDSRERGPAMVDLVKTYEQAGLLLAPEELPDHLCVVLEFASTQPPRQAQEFLGEMAHILRAIFSALLQRGSPYAALVARCWNSLGKRCKPFPSNPMKRWTKAGPSPKSLAAAVPRARPSPARPNRSTSFATTQPP